jgi:hypothetical protein
MSKETLQAFAEAVSKSEELQKRLASIQVETAKSTAEQIAKLSERAGTPFTAEEYLKSVAESSEEQLHTVAGGVWDPTPGNILMSIAAVFMCAMRALMSTKPGADADDCQWQKK